MVYKVIGLMSGSSLDGLDIAYVQLEDVRGAWSYELIAAECIPYEAEMLEKLKNAASMNVAGFLPFHTAYGHYIGATVNAFIARHSLEHKVHFIASHGHTVFHNPAAKTTFQLGDGAAIAALTGLPVISDLRSMDVALGGQGAPIVPMGDQLLFGNYDYWLNLGGIANVTVQQGDHWQAFDIAACNQVLNALAARMGQEYDKDGAAAASGALIPEVMIALNQLPYYDQPSPKSLDNQFSIDAMLPLLTSNYEPKHLLHTATVHIAQQVAKALAPFEKGQAGLLLATGGGALNKFLVEKLIEALAPKHISVIVPEEHVVLFKEALVMAFLGTLRWREEITVLSSVTGAKQDSVGGALWLGPALPVFE